MLDRIILRDHSFSLSLSLSLFLFFFPLFYARRPKFQRGDPFCSNLIPLAVKREGKASTPDAGRTFGDFKFRLGQHRRSRPRARAFKLFIPEPLPDLERSLISSFTWNNRETPSRMCIKSHTFSSSLLPCLVPQPSASSFTELARNLASGTKREITFEIFQGRAIALTTSRDARHIGINLSKTASDSRQRVGNLEGGKGENATLLDLIV